VHDSILGPVRSLSAVCEGYTRAYDRQGGRDMYIGIGTLLIIILLIVLLT
jgi:hypothetical protein